MKFKFLISFLFFALIFFYNINLKAQNQYFLSVNHHTAYIIPHHKYFNYFNVGKINSFEIQVGKKTLGNKFWQYSYKLPDLGISFYYSSLNKNEYLGKVFAFYSFINGNFSENKNVNLTYNIGLGAEYGTEKFDITSNLYNTAIGSSFNIFIKLGSGINIKLYRNLYFKTEIFFTHFSDGATRKPNKGINILSLNTGFLYYFNKYNFENFVPETEIFDKNKVLILYSAGMHRNSLHDTKSMFACSFTVDYIYRPFYKSAFGIGADIFYDSAKNKYVDLYHSDSYNGNLFYPDIHLAYYLYFGKIAFLLQAGPYIYFKPGINKNIFSRIGLRYNLTKNITANFSLKTYLGIAEFVEVGAGYNFVFKKNKK
jgi:hypothetical protein